MEPTALKNTTAILLAVLVEEKEPLVSNDYHLFETGLKEIYWSKRMLIKFLDQMIRETSSDELPDILEEHQVITHRQSRRLEDVFSILSLHPEARICPPVKKIISATYHEVSGTEKGHVKDIEIISAVLDIQAYWVSNCTAIEEFAGTFGYEKIKLLIDEIKQEDNLVIERLKYLKRKDIN